MFGASRGSEAAAENCMTEVWSKTQYSDYLASTGKRSINREVKTDYKAQFEQQLSLVGIKFKREFYFALPRKWRSDWLIIGTKILVEFEGGLFAKRAAGHSSVSGILRDLNKYNEATLRGYMLIRIAPPHVVSGQALKWVERAILLDQLGHTPDNDRSN